MYATPASSPRQRGILYFYAHPMATLSIQLAIGIEAFALGVTRPGLSNAYLATTLALAVHAARFRTLDNSDQGAPKVVNPRWDTGSSTPSVPSLAPADSLRCCDISREAAVPYRRLTEEGPRFIPRSQSIVQGRPVWARPRTLRAPL